MISLIGTNLEQNVDACGRLNTALTHAGGFGLVLASSDGSFAAEAEANSNSVALKRLK